MSSTTTTLKLLLIGEDRSASKAIKGLGDTTGKTGTSMGKVFSGLAAGFAALGAADFAKDSINAFKDLGSQVMGLQRITGGSVEDVSRLRFALKQSGVDVDGASKAIGKFEKGLGAAAKSAKATEAMTKLLGTSFRDSSGKIKPMTELLPQLAEKFKSMPNGAEKTALAMQLFGKSGTDMLPFLNKGSAGIKDLAKQADKFGLTLSGPQVDALKKAKAAQREWDASIEGVQVSLGANLLPVVTGFMTFLRDQAIPVLKTVVQWMGENKDIIATVAGVVVGAVAAFKLVTAATKAWAVVQALLNGTMALNPVGLVVVAIAALVAALVIAYQRSETFRQVVTTAFNAVKAAGLAVWELGIKPMVQLVLRGFSALAGAVAAFLDHLGDIPGFGWAKDAARSMKAAADQAYRIANGLDSIPSVVHSKVFVTTITNKVDKQSGGKLYGYASGGRPPVGSPAIFGEEGPELWIPDAPGTVIPTSQTAAILARNGGPSPLAAAAGGSREAPQPVTIQVLMDSRVVWQQLLQLKRRGGVVSMGLA